MPVPVPIYRRSALVFECAALLVLLAALAPRTLGLPRHSQSFAVTRLLKDGERDRRVHHRGVTAQETAAFRGSGVGIRLLQVTDGRHFVQGIYDAAGALKDCEYVRDNETVRQFLVKLEPDFVRAQTLRQHPETGSTAGDKHSVNGTMTLLSRGHIVDEWRDLLDYEQVRADCKELHQQVKDRVKENGRTHRDSGASRKKRELFIYPGTNWCGVGSSSERFNELGWNAAADRCCRQHDHCPLTIMGFKTKYNLYNFRFHTLSHCECDERFRTCLKMVDNGPSNLVGKIFFNVVQMKCFVLKAEKKCLTTSWWGRCLKYEKQLTAHVRDVLSY